MDTTEKHNPELAIVRDELAAVERSLNRIVATMRRAQGSRRLAAVVLARLERVFRDAANDAGAACRHRLGEAVANARNADPNSRHR